MEMGNSMGSDGSDLVMRVMEDSLPREEMKNELKSLAFDAP